MPHSSHPDGGGEQPPASAYGTIIAMGGSCFVSHADNGQVLKGYQIWVNGKRQSYYPMSCEEDLAREEMVYKRLGEHPRILRCFGLEEIRPGMHSLRLEFAPLGNVREYITMRHPQDPLPEQARLRMSLDAAEGLAHLHSRKVLYSDMSCRNLLLFDDYRVKLCDFGASFMEGYDFKRTVCEEPQYELPCRGRSLDDRPRIKRELFALGSAIYEIMAWRRPWQGLTIEEVEEKYANEEFPDTSEIVAGEIIQKCWNEAYNSADEVTKSLNDYVGKGVGCGGGDESEGSAAV